MGAPNNQSFSVDLVKAFEAKLIFDNDHKTFAAQCPEHLLDVRVLCDQVSAHEVGQQEFLSLIEGASRLSQVKVLVARSDSLVDIDGAHFDHCAVVVVGQSIHNWVHEV